MLGEVDSSNLTAGFLGLVAVVCVVVCVVVWLHMREWSRPPPKK